MKAAEKSKQISLDLKTQGEEKVQHLTDTFIKRIDEVLAAKEKEILEV